MSEGSARGWLLDTNVISELRKGAKSWTSVRLWAEQVPPSACYLNSITLAEIRFGIEQVADPGFRGELEAWLQDGVRAWFGQRILPIDEAVLVMWRRLAWEGQKAGYTYSQPDALIAATAKVHGLGVATRNIKDFVRAGVLVFDPWKGAAKGPVRF